MGRPKGSKNVQQSVDANSINLTGAQAPVTAAPKAQGANTIGKVMRTVTITFQVGTLTARKSAGGFIACNGRGVDADGITWNIPTAMPLNPSNGKSCPVDGVDLSDFLGI
jgi:predicted phage tail protein